MDDLKMYVINFGYTGSASVMARSKEEALKFFKDQLYDFYSNKLGISDLMEYKEGEVDINFGDE